jgi:FeS assembly SUF system protein
MRHLKLQPTRRNQKRTNNPKKGTSVPFFFEQFSIGIGFLNMTLTDEELREEVRKTIKTIYDPEIPVDIYELGLIYEIEVYPVNNVYIKMTLTSPNCPSAGTIPEEVRSKVQAMEGMGEVHVELTFDPPYHQDMMSEAAKLELGFL